MATLKTKQECAVCLGEHDEQIHSATLRIHAWWRESLMHRLSGRDGWSDEPDEAELEMLQAG